MTKGIGLALGAGGARGYAHVAVVEKLLESGVIIDEIAGSSAGAMVGAYFALTGEVGKILDVQRRMKPRDFQRIMEPNFPTQSLFKSTRLEAFIRKNYLGDHTFADLLYPLKICAVDIQAQEPVYIEDGDLTKAVVASSTIPGLMNPVKHQGRLFVDGGVMEPVPSKVLLECGCRKVVAVNLNKYAYATNEEMNVIEILTESFHLMMRSMAEKGMMHKKVYEIAPSFENAPSIHLDFSQVGFNYNAGVEVMERELPALKKWLEA